MKSRAVPDTELDTTGEAESAWYGTYPLEDDGVAGEAVEKDMLIT